MTKKGLLGFLDNLLYKNNRISKERYFQED